MDSFNKFIFSALIAFLLLIIPIANAVSYFSQDWSYPTYDDTSIPPHALVSIGQTAYFGSSVVPSPTNYLYAVNIISGKLIWRHNTSLSINVLSRFEYEGNESVVVGTGDISAFYEGHVIALSQDNKTLWEWPALNSSSTPYVTSLGSAKSNVANTEDVVAGLQNGTVIRLSGNNGSVQWQYNCAGIVYDIVQLDNGSVVVGTSGGGQGHTYCLEKNDSLAWSYTSTPLRLVKRFGSLNDVVAAFTDVIDVRNGTTGAEIALFNATKRIAPFNVMQQVTDLLCTEDYTGDGFPDIVAATENGTASFLMIINGSNGVLFQGPAPVSSSLALPNIQYMYSYENGMSFLNKTLAVSVEGLSGSNYVGGVNASDLTIMNRFQVSSTALNLINVGNYTSSFTGDLLFSVGYTAYDISGTSIITPEFPSQIMLVFLILAVWLLVAILGRGRSRIR